MASTAQQRLARRAKWRRWFQKWKSRLLLAFVLLMIAIVVLFSQMHVIVKPALIAQVEKHIDNDEDVPRYLIQRMYTIGRLLEISMHTSEAKKCYETLIDWAYDDNGSKVFRITTLPDEYDAFIEPDFDPVIGYALFRYNEILKTKFKQQAYYVRQLYLKDIIDLPDSDKNYNDNVKVSQQLYNAGN